MARPLSQTLKTLIRSPTATASDLSALRLLVRRRHSTRPKIDSYVEAEARAVEKIEDAIHDIIIKRSKPDWLPFVPGASYWAPPRRSSYGVAEIVNKLANALTEEEHMCLTTFQGWPSSAFYIDNNAPAPIDSTEGEPVSTNACLQEKEEG
ncbi:hypothetical protein BUALT_Bualt02G0129200 [Buddleja alternifolia]|uniref:Uncharacterized protein n=1 Tax=Buddleja alternifolia TaxID=168488 RepID=A0AAV6Y6I8_9LAMI|nr:hypothetical protein BUALT_Bualt02G0129200 [Buddleja alternifolia]